MFFLVFFTYYRTRNFHRKNKFKAHKFEDNAGGLVPRSPIHKLKCTTRTKTDLNHHGRILPLQLLTSCCAVSFLFTLSIPHSSLLPLIFFTRIFFGVIFQLHQGAGASFNGYEDSAGVLAKAEANLAAYPENRCCKYILQLKNEGKLDSMSAEDLSKLFLCAKTGLDNVESGLGCYAMGPKDYEDFDFFFGKYCTERKLTCIFYENISNISHVFYACSSVQ